MISFIRKYITSWPVLALLGLVLIAFVVTGIGDPFAGGGTGGSLARVGKTDIGEAAFLKQYDRVVTQARTQNPGLTAQTAAQQGAVEQVLDQMAGGAALDEFAAKHGITVSDKLVDGAIASIDAFRIGGKFDQATYLKLLQQRGLTDKELREGLRSDMIRKALLVPVAAGAQVPREVALPYTRLLLDIHEGEAGIIPPPVVAPPSDAQVAAYLTANRARFMAPERRGFRYALIDRATLAAAVPVTDAEVAAYYNANRATFGGIEQRRLAQVVLPDAAKAQAFVAAVTKGESFTAAAARLAGAAPDDVSLGLLTQPKYAAAANTALAAQVFAAASGAVVGPVRTDFGFNVVKVEAVVAPAGKSLATLTPEISAKLRTDKAEAKLADMVASIEDGFGTGDSFADAVKTNALTAVTVAPVAKDGAGVPPGALTVVAKAFDVDPADGASVQDLGEGRFAVLELGQVIAPAPLPMAAARPGVIAALTADLRAKASKATADAVIADVAKGTKFAAALASRGLAKPQPIKGRRIDVGNQQQVPPAIAAFLTMAPGQTRAIPGPGGAVALVHVDRIIPGDLAQAPPLLAATRQQLAQLAPDEIASAFGRAVEREVGIKTNPGVVAATKRRILGDPATP